MPYNEKLYAKYYELIDVASQSCRIRNSLIRKWRDYGDLAKAIDEIIALNYSGTNVELLIEIKERYQNDKRNNLH